jgi:hypothetical protein
MRSTVTFKMSNGCFYISITFCSKGIFGEIKITMTTYCVCEAVSREKFTRILIKLALLVFYT